MAIEIAERHADGRATQTDLRDAWRSLDDLRFRYLRQQDSACLTLLAVGSACSSPDGLSRAAITAAGAVFHSNGSDGVKAEQSLQCDILRDLFGPLPFRAKPAIPAAALAWNDGCVAKLATSVYQERDFSAERLGVLADALEEAGVADEEVLGHLRGPGPHCRGCWVVDLVLGKE